MDPTPNNKLHTGQQSQHFSQFTNTLKEYEISFLNAKDGKNGNVPDIFDVVKEFRSIAAQSAARILSSHGEPTVESQNWELEAKFWYLFDLMMSFRAYTENEGNGKTETEKLHTYNSSAIFEKKLLQENRELYQIWIIIVWIQQNLPAIERPSNVVTSKWSNSLISGGLQSADLDYPLRDPSNTKNIDNKDKEQDHTFFKYVYHLIIAGRFEEAFNECRLSENLTLCMIMCGMQEYVNPKIDESVTTEFETQQGIKKHALWRSTVFNLSQQPQLDPYERAIYSFLAGSLPDSAVLDDSNWETELLLNMNQIIQIEVENYLLKEGKSDNKEIIVPVPRTAPTLESILNILSIKHKEESQHPIRVLIGSVILNTLPQVIHSSIGMIVDIVKGRDTTNDIIDEPYLLRILTHLTIVVDEIEPGSIPEEDKIQLITTYISILKLKGLYDSIPVYVSFLDDDAILEAYSFILCTVDDPTVRQSQLNLMNLLRLPSNNILKRTTERIFSDTEEFYIPKDTIAITSEISDVDKHLMFGVEWLLQGHIYSDGLQSVVAMCRRLLLNGKVEALQSFFEANDMTAVIQNFAGERATIDQPGAPFDESGIQEIKQYMFLTTGFKKYKEWQRAVTKLNSESNIPTQIEIFQEYSRYSLELVKSFLVELTQDDTTVDFPVLYEIRALYTPYLIIELHRGLVNASELLQIPTFISDALKITNVVANETDKIYLLFQTSGKLEEYLQLVAKTATYVK